MHTNRTGRQLDVEAMANATNKITLGFKCEPQVKMAMAMEAKEYGMSLSEYAEVIASTRHDSGSNQEQQELLKEIKSLKAKIGFYESDLLRKHLEANRGEINHFTDSLGNHREIQITSLEDIYTVIINSIKLRS